MSNYFDFLKENKDSKKITSLISFLEGNKNYTITDISFNEEANSLRLYILINSKDKIESLNYFNMLLEKTSHYSISKFISDRITSLILSPKNNGIHFIRVSHFAIEIEKKRILLKPYFTIDENEEIGDVNYFIGDFRNKLMCLRELTKPINKKFMQTFLNGNLWKKYHIQFGYKIENEEILSQKMYCEIPNENFSLEEMSEIHEELMTSYVNTEYENLCENFVKNIKSIIPIIQKSEYLPHIFTLEANNKRECAFRYYIAPLNPDNTTSLFHNLLTTNWISKSQFNNLTNDVREKQKYGFKIYDVGVTFKNENLKVTTTYCL